MTATLVLVGVDPPRLLAQRSELGYTEREDLAMIDEPEAVSADEQRRQTTVARRRDRQTWIESRDTIRAALEPLQAQSFAYLERDLRALARLVERIDHRVPV